MASRQTAGTTSAFQYAAPATYAVAATDIALSNQTSNPGAAWMSSGNLGLSNTATSQLLPVLPLNATPSVNGLSSVTTTGTVFLGTPHGLTASGSTFTLSGAAIAGYNCTACTVASVTGPYSFTYTLAGGGSGLANSGSGQVSLLGGSGAALRPYQVALNGASIGGSTTGPVEIWADGAIWDTTNSRYIYPQLGPIDPANLSTARS
jgi:hypothetical protein